MAALVVEALFVVVFAQALIAYVRTRDPLQRDVMLVFSALAGLLVVGLIRQLWGEPPALVGALSSMWLLGQPYWMLRVIARLRAVPRWVRWVAAAGWAGTAAPLLLAGRTLPEPLILAAVLVFVGSELTAAGYLVAEARRRAGASRRRLWCAAFGTAAFAAAIVVAGVGTALPGHAAVVAAVSQGLALLSALGYLMAFMPPRWLRRVWSAQTAYDLIGRLLAEPPGLNPEQSWQRYVRSVRRTAAADAALVIIPGSDGLMTQADCSPAGCDFGAVDPEGIGELVSIGRTVDVRTVDRGRAVPLLATALAARIGARYVTAAPLHLRPNGTSDDGSDDGHGALVLLNTYRSLFEDDDAQLLAKLAVQAAALAEQGRLTAELAASADAAAAASKAKSDFLANMSHELRTPLNAIIGFSELMAEEEPDGDLRPVPKEWIDHVRTGGHHLLGLINDVLDLSKVEAGRIELLREPLDLPRIIDEAAATLGPLIRAHDLKVMIAVPPLTVPADRVRFRQILDNLLSNAIKFTPTGGEIFVTAHRSGDLVHVLVTDTGPGIAPDEHAKVFTEFTQVGDASLRKGGTGLGLPLARRLAQAHGGDITLESEPGHGARFTVTLPGARHAESGERAATGSVPSSGGGILVIEDDPAAALLLRTHLERAGYLVSLAATGEEGLVAAHTGEPDLILLDLILPGIDGRTVLQRLKDDPQVRHIPVAVISVADDREVGMALGAIDYFTKPVNHDALLAWLVRFGFIPPLSDRDTNVLVIDDDPATLAVVGQTLQRQGIRAVDATNAIDGLRLARAHPFDLIICDLLMPGLDGFTVIAALHDDPVTRGIPVLVLTAQDLSQADRSRLDGKTLAVISKGEAAPADLQTWVQRITELTRVTR